MHLEPDAAVKAEIEQTGTHAVTWLEVCHRATGAVTSRKIVRASRVAAYDRAVAAAYTRERLPPIVVNGRNIAVCEVVIADSDPPPPPPPPPPSIVPPAALEAFRTSGSKTIDPDDATKHQIAASGRTKIIGTFKLCVDVSGAITDVKTLKSTSFGAYDDNITKTIQQTWKYKPILVQGRPTPVCTAVTFIYSVP